MELSELAKQGLLGFFLAMSLGLNGILGKMLLYEKDKRIAEAKENRDSLVQPITYIKDSISLMEKKIRISKGQE